MAPLAPRGGRWRRTLVVLGLLNLGLPLVAQNTTLRLPLPVDGLSGPVGFDSLGPTAAVLTGLQLPAEGPLTAWAPVFSTLGADGQLGTGQTGAWVGRLPARWVKLVKPGYVVAGFRVLVRTAPAPVETRQIQVFWKPWTDGAPSDPVVESQVYGAKAGPKDTVRIIELRLPDGAVPTGLYGQVQGGAVVQVSLVVRQEARATEPVPAATTKSPQGPPAPGGPTIQGPVAPTLLN